MCCRQLLPGRQSERDYSSFQHWEGEFCGWELLKLTLIPLGVALTSTVCFTAVFPGRCCGLLDSWSCSLIAVGEGGVRGEKEREKKKERERWQHVTFANTSVNIPALIPLVVSLTWVITAGSAVQPDLYQDVKYSHTSVYLKSCMEDGGTFKRSQVCFAWI